MGELYMVNTSTGERSLIGEMIDSSTVPVEPIIPDFLIKSFNIPDTATFTAEVDRKAMLSLFYGHKITNNWLKRHGGVMSRKIHRRYRE